jgi:hypothetical protein
MATTRFRRLLITALAAAACGVSAAPAAASRMYGGQKTSERLQMVFAVSDDGATLESAAVLAELNCRGYNRIDTATTTSVAALPAEPRPGVLYLAGQAIAGGRLDATLLIAREYAPGRTDVVSGALTGTLTANGGRGTLALTSRVVEDATGRLVRTCSRTLPWRVLRRPGRLFAGNTSQGAPIVLLLSADRRRVVRSLIGWTARCRRASYYAEPHDDFLLPFRLTASGTFVQRYRYDAGGGADVIGRFGGRFRERTASGVFRSRVRGGGERCDTGRRTWTARTG